MTKEEQALQAVIESDQCKPLTKWQRAWVRSAAADYMLHQDQDAERARVVKQGERLLGYWGDGC